MTATPTTYEYFLYPVSATQAARVPMPVGLTDAEKEAYAANPPAEAIAEAARWPLPAPPDDAMTVDSTAPLATLTDHFTEAQLDPEREDF